MIPLFPNDSGHAEEMAIQMQRDQNRIRLASAFDRLFHELKHWVRAYPRSSDEDLPDHSIAWLTPYNNADGPHEIVRNAIKCEPALWWDALPDDVVVIPKSTFEMLVRESVKAGEEEGVTQMAQTMAIYAVENAAGRFRQALHERRRHPSSFKAASHMEQK